MRPLSQRSSNVVTRMQRPEVWPDLRPQGSRWCDPSVRVGRRVSRCRTSSVTSACGPGTVWWSADCCPARPGQSRRRSCRFAAPVSGCMNSSSAHTAGHRAFVVGKLAQLFIACQNFLEMLAVGLCWHLNHVISWAVRLPNTLPCISFERTCPLSSSEVVCMQGYFSCHLNIKCVVDMW